MFETEAFLQTDLYIRILNHSKSFMPTMADFDTYLKRIQNEKEFYWTSYIWRTNSSIIGENTIILFSYDSKIKALGIVEKVERISCIEEGIEYKFKIILKDIYMLIPFLKEELEKEFQFTCGRIGSLETSNILFKEFLLKKKVISDKLPARSFQVSKEKESKIAGTSEIAHLKQEKGKKAEKYIMDFFLNLGFEISDVSECAINHYDLLLQQKIGIEVKNIQNTGCFYLSNDEIYQIKHHDVILCLTDLNQIWISKPYSTLQTIPVLFDQMEEIKRDVIEKYDGRFSVEDIAISCRELEMDMIPLINLSKEDIEGIFL